jgi:hypothetical protein
MRRSDAALPGVRALLGRTRRALGLGVALALSLPVAALVRFDRAAGGLHWALQPSALPDADWPGSWSPVVVTAAAQQTEALGDALELLVLLALLMWLAALADAVLASLRSVAGDPHGWAVRSAVGATRRQLGREVVLGRLRFAGLAVALGLGGASLVCALLPMALPPSLDLSGPGGPAMLVASPLVPLLVVVTVMAAVCLPLLLIPGPHELRRPALHLGTGRRRTDAGGRRDGRLAWIGDVAWWLAAGQIGACIAIVVCTAFLVRAAPDPASAARAYPYARDTLVLRVRLPDDGQRTERWQAVRAAAVGLPGVRIASVSTPGALLGLGSLDRAGTDCAGCGGGGLGAPITVGLARHLAVDGDFFALLGLDPEAAPGQAPDGSAPDGGRQGVVIDRTFRDRLFQGQSVQGRRVWLRGSLPLRDPGARVVGIVRTPSFTGLAVRRRPIPTIYAPLGQHPPRVADLAIRYEARSADVPDSELAAAGAAADTVRAAVPGAEVAALGRLSDLVEAQAATVRRLGRATLSLGLAAFLLALFGASDAAIERVRERTWEIGLRRALGARRGAVIRLVAADGARLVGVGVLAGVAVGLGVNRGLPVLVDRVPPLSGAAVAGFALLVATLGLAAAFAATRRALRLDPVAALRE